MENAIAFGALFPGDPDIMHQADEYISVEPDESGYEVLVVKQFSITEYVKTATEIVANMIESL